LLPFFDTGSHYAAQAGLELEILLPQLPEWYISGVCHHTQLNKNGFQKSVLFHHFSTLNDISLQLLCFQCDIAIPIL
jgi:hypothetical protein